MTIIPFNGKGDGSDETAYFQYLVDQAPAGATISIGRVKVGLTSVSINKPLRIQGESYAGSFIVPLADVDCLKFNVGGASKQFSPMLSDLAISPITVRSAGSAIRLGNVGKATLSNLKIDGALGGKVFEGIRYDMVSETGCTNVHISGCGSSGVIIQNSGGTCVDTIFDPLCSISSCQGYGMELRGSSGGDVEGLQLYGVRFSANNQGALLLNSDLGVIRNIHCHAVKFDSSIIHGVYASGAQRIENLVFTDCWSSNNQIGYGYYLGPSVIDSIVTGGNVMLNGLDGVVIAGSQNLTITSLDIWDNGQLGAGNAYGVKVMGTAKGIGLITNRIRTVAKNNYRTGQIPVYVDPYADCHQFGTWVTS